MIGYILIVVGTIISIANPVVEAAEVTGPQQKESKTYEKCVSAASERNTHHWSEPLGMKCCEH